MREDSNGRPCEAELRQEQLKTSLRSPEDWIQENLLRTASGVICDEEVCYGSMGYHLSLKQSDSAQYYGCSTVQVIM